MKCPPTCEDRLQNLRMRGTAREEAGDESPPTCEDRLQNLRMRGRAREEAGDIVLVLVKRKGQLI